MRGKAELRILKLASVFHHLPSVGPKQLCALAHLGCPREAITYFLEFNITQIIFGIIAFRILQVSKHQTARPRLAFSHIITWCMYQKPGELRIMGPLVLKDRDAR